MSIKWRIDTFDQCPSTQDYLKALDNPTHGLVIQAHKQTHAHGRHGRIWHSGEGNLCLSLALCPSDLDKCLPYIGLLALGAGIALHHTIKMYINTDIDIVLKWPNDVLLNGKKCAGLLLERHQNALILGVGLNITSKPVTENAACLSEFRDSSTTSTDIDIIRNHFLTALSHIYENWLNKEYAVLHACFMHLFARS